MVSKRDADEAGLVDREDSDVESCLLLAPTVSTRCRRFRHRTRGAPALKHRITVLKTSVGNNRGWLGGKARGSDHILAIFATAEFTAIRRNELSRTFCRVCPPRILIKKKKHSVGSLKLTQLKSF